MSHKGPLPVAVLAVLRKSADQSSIGSTSTDVSSLTVAVASGQTIRFHAFLRVTNSSSLLGAMVSCNGPTASPVMFQTTEWTASTTPAWNHQVTFDSFSALTTAAGSTEVMYEVKGVATFSAGGTFAIRAKSALTGTMNVLAGSHMEYDLQ